VGSGGEEDYEGRIMIKVKNGHFVKVDYTGTMENGDVFDSSRERSPMEIEVGAGQVIKGFERALIGMGEKEKKTFTVSPGEGYGERDDSLEQVFPRSDLPEHFSPKEGEVVTLETPDGKEIPALVSKTDDSSITIDLNHPLAGQSLTFEIEVVEIHNHSTEPACDSGCCKSCSC
jgi:peptidylprolyl isomerase